MEQMGLTPELSDAAEDDSNVTMSLASLMRLARRVRDEGRLPTAAEKEAFERGYACLDAGYSLPTAWCPLGTSGSRPIQTWLSLADPGPGHLSVTVTRNDLLHGTVVHLERIDRGRQADRARVEAYGLPSPRYAVRVRLHVGTQSPVTAFIGRPVFENRALDPTNPTAPVDADTFRLDLPKALRLHVATCSSMFRSGIADCKIAIEHMSSSQAIKFMRGLARGVLRDRARQSLSAAFNINTPLTVDHDGPSRILERPMEIALMGIDIARRSGFEKVTWDSASGTVPSEPIIGLLSFADLVDLAHSAHEQGLETYISGGMRPEHMRDATYAGVDGVGIGTRLHCDEGKSRSIDPDAILEALRVRDEASCELLGKAARLLARLDMSASRNQLACRADVLRKQLHRALRSRDADATGCLVDDLSRASGMSNTW